MADPRFQAVYDAASFLFIKKGYAKTQVAQIADAAGIATGTIYNLFSGKKSILHFVLLSSFDKHYFDGDSMLPVKEVDHEVIIEYLAQTAEELLVKIEGRAKDGQPELSFAGMLSSLFDYTSNYHVAFSIINDEREVLPDIEKKYRYYVDYVYKVIEENLMCYIERGEVRKIELPGLHIRNMIEGITWWAMYLPYQAPEVKIPASKAKDIALDILKHAYLTKLD